MNPGDRVLVKKTTLIGEEEVPAVFVRHESSNWPYRYVATRTDYAGATPEKWAVCRLAPTEPLFKSTTEADEFQAEVEKAARSRARDNALEVAKALQSEVLRVEDIPSSVLHVLRYYLTQGEMK